MAGRAIKLGGFSQGNRGGTPMTETTIPAAYGDLRWRIIEFFGTHLA